MIVVGYVYNGLPQLFLSLAISLTRTVLVFFALTLPKTFGEKLAIALTLSIVPLFLQPQNEISGAVYILAIPVIAVLFSLLLLLEYNRMNTKAVIALAGLAGIFVLFSLMLLMQSQPGMFGLGRR